MSYRSLCTSVTLNPTSLNLNLTSHSSSFLQYMLEEEICKFVCLTCKLPCSVTTLVLNIVFNLTHFGVSCVWFCIDVSFVERTVSHLVCGNWLAMCSLIMFGTASNCQISYQAFTHTWLDQWFPDLTDEIATVWGPAGLSCNWCLIIEWRIITLISRGLVEELPHEGQHCLSFSFSPCVLVSLALLPHCLELHV